MFGGCGTQTEIGAPPATLQSVVPSERSGGGASWVVPEAKSENLYYVSDVEKGAVYIFSYPQGKLFGKLTGLDPRGMCADKTGDVWVASSMGYGVGEVVEYAHGGASPIRTLKNSYPNGCAVDATTGNLAVTEGQGYKHGAVAVYTMAKGSPKVYRNPAISAAAFCGYDNKGNLFIDGYGSGLSFVFAELAKGSAKVKQIRFGRTVANPGGVQWDGKYVAVGDYTAGLIYRTNGASGKVADTVTLDSGVYVEQFWIQGSTIIGPNAQTDGTVGFWHYPAGGFPVKTMKGFDFPVGAVVSLAQ
jgi:hypothetical protein